MRQRPVPITLTPHPDELLSGWLARLFCLAATAVVQARPLLKAAMFSTGIDDFAYAALLRTYEKEPRLLATIGRITKQSRRKADLPETEAHN